MLDKLGFIEAQIALKLTQRISQSELTESAHSGNLGGACWQGCNVAAKAGNFVCIPKKASNLEISVNEGRRLTWWGSDE